MHTENASRSTEIGESIALFIVNDLNWDGTVEALLGPSPVDLPSILDSADLLELAGFLEDNFGVVIDDEEIVADNFSSVMRLAVIVADKESSGES